MRVEGADGVPGQLGQLHRSRLHLVQRPAGAVGSKNRPTPTLDSPGQRQQATGPGSSARPPCRQKAKPFYRARDQFTIEATADQDRQPESTVKIAGAGNKATMPETPNLQSRRGRRFCARLHHYFIAQGPVESPQEQGDEPGNHPEAEPLAVAEAIGRVVHRAILQAANRAPRHRIIRSGHSPAPLRIYSPAGKRTTARGSTLVMAETARFGTCFVADSRAWFAAATRPGPQVTRGTVEWGSRLAPLGPGNSEIDAFPPPRG